MIGFIRFTEPTPVVEPTVLERISLLSTGQKTGLLNYFIMGRSVINTARELKINHNLVARVFETINNIQQTAKSYMRGEVVITPAVLDAEGNIITPAVMNTAPTTQTALSTILQPMFTDIFITAQTTAIVSAMIKWSKFDGTGTFTFYATNIKL